MPNNIILSDSVISHVLQLHRLEAGISRDILNILKSMRDNLILKLNASNITVSEKHRLGNLFDKADEIIEQSYIDAKSVLDDVVNDLVFEEADFVKKIIQSSIPIDITVAFPTTDILRTLATDTLVNGIPSSTWWEKQEDDVRRRFRNAIRDGLLTGETPIQMGRSLRQTLGVSQSNAQSLVQTSVSAVSNRARNEVFERNNNVIKALKWLSTLDNKICYLCISRSDKKWENNKDHTPIGHSIPYRSPPIHFNDRCVIVPVVKTFDELGIDLPEPREGTRPSVVDGVAIPQPSSTTFKSFLSRQSVEFQNKTLGVGRAELWRSGRISLTDLTNGRGRELTIDELKNLND